MNKFDMFMDWEEVPIERTRNYQCLDHQIVIERINKKDEKALQLRLRISKDIMRENKVKEGTKYTIKKNGVVFALVPDENGPLVYDGQKFGGCSTKTLQKILSTLGGDVNVRNAYAVCSVNGVLVFPSPAFWIKE